MITNKIVQLSETEAKNLISACAQDKNLFLATINMTHTQTWEQFAEALGNAFQLPMRNEGFDGTLDWMQDLDWLNREAYAIILYNYSKLSNSEVKKLLIEFFAIITQWWEKDVTQFCVGGKAKSFNVYLVD